MATDTVDFSYSLVDELGTTAVARFPGTSDDASTLAELVAAAQSVGTDLDAVTGAKITETRIVVKPTLTGLKGSPVAGSRVEQTAVINLRTAETAYRYGVAIPAIRDSLISAGRLTTGGVVGVLVDTLIASGGTVQFTNHVAQALTSVVDYVLSFRKRRKSLIRTSFEEA
jgi:hypothetical protein